MKWLLSELRSLLVIYLVLLVLMIAGRLAWLGGVELYETNPAAFAIAANGFAVVLVAVVVKFGLKIVFGR